MKRTLLFMTRILASMVMSIMTLTVTADVKINEITFPDSNFRDWVLSQEYGADGVLTNEEVETIESLNISRLEIHDLKGIEYFTALKVLNCMTNKLTSLDLSKNTALEKLECNGNRLTTINLLENKELRFLNCGGVSYGNQLTSLDVSNCTELDTLACAGNPLKTLDVSKNTKLICLECYSNQLTSLDLSKNTALRRLHCNNNQLTTLDVSNNSALNLLVCSDNQLTTLDLTKNSVLSSLTCMNNKLTTLYVSDNKSLEWLSCFNNQLTSLDVSGCSALKSLGCSNNQLTTLNLSGCSTLEQFNCCNNQLTTLDLSENTALKMLYCLQNQIKGIGMDALVESLPIVSEGSLRVMNIENEQNVMTTTQVAAAKAKGWTPYVWTYGEYREYAGSETTQNDYIPFVEMGKQWHVVRSDCDTSTPLVKFENYMLNEEVVKDGKTYLKLNLREDNKTEVYDTGLLREEDCKVYYYRPNTQKEVLMFDYSLQAGDTYESNNVTYKVLSVSDYLEGPEVVSYDYDVKADSVVTHRRYLRKWTVGRTDNELFQKTWIEGVGSLEGPLAYLNDIVLPGMCQDNLAYVEIVNDSDGHYLYLPFSFYDTLNLLVHGCNLPTGEADWSEDCHHQLTYELEGDRLHVYGKVYSNCGRNNYAYFIEKPTDDPLVHRIEFEIEAAEPAATCMTLHATDFYVPGFDPNLNYIIVDNQGEEHPVINKTPQMAYRPFVEEGKVWKVGHGGSGNPVQVVEYYYFDGDTIINEKTCKQMMRQRFVSPEHPDYSQSPSVSYEGAWYEEGQKVYYYNARNKQFRLWYDFSVGANDTIQIKGYNRYVIGPKQTGGLKGFKGVYRDVTQIIGGEGQGIYNTTWLEGVGGIDGPMANVYYGKEGHPLFLMECFVGDEVIYLNDDYEDGATPGGMNARKRFDFTHTTKEQPKMPMRRDAEQSLYGEYNDKLLGINLDPIDDAYLVRITDEAGKTVYEKAINAGNIVGLNIDISSYPKGRYTVTVENSVEAFTGEFDAQTTGIEEVRSQKSEIRGAIYNLQGQRLTGKPAKGLYIQNGRKVMVK